MYPRLLPRPTESAFLFGPRGTGKSTWIRDRFSGAPTYDLLDPGESLRLLGDPGLPWQELQHLPPRTWVVIDEVQKVPAVLNTVHRLIELRRLRFVLSGSSARPLRRGGVNLLAGRARTARMFPLVSGELGGDADAARILRHGSLPTAVTGRGPADFLRSYAETYLLEEVKAEGLARSLGGFARFLEVAARQNGQVTNVAGIARDVGIARRTVAGYFEVLIDTLIGAWLPSWKRKPSNRQVQQSRFFFFDPGVVRALAGRLPLPPTPEEQGPLLETWLFGELRAFLSYRGLHYPLSFWRSYSGAEVDFLIETPTGFVGVEVKASQRWERRFLRGFAQLEKDCGPGEIRGYGVYLGDREARWGQIEVLPALDFLRRLWAGEVLE